MTDEVAPRSNPAEVIASVFVNVFNVHGNYHIPWAEGTIIISDDGEAMGEERWMAGEYTNPAEDDEPARAWFAPTVEELVRIVDMATEEG